MMKKLHPTHIRENNNEILTEQTATDHCRNTARYASYSLCPVGLGSIGIRCGPTLSGTATGQNWKATTTRTSITTLPVGGRKNAMRPMKTTRT